MRILLLLTLLVGCQRVTTPTALEDESACAKGDEASCNRRLDRMKASCEKKTVKDCVDVADAYTTPMHAPKDDKQGAIYFDKACELGDARSCGMLSNQYFAGRGVVRDFDKAIALDEKACGLGYGDSCRDLGRCFETGDITRGCKAKDLKKARGFWAKACEIDKASDCEQTARIDKELGAKP